MRKSRLALVLAAAQIVAASLGAAADDAAAPIDLVVAIDTSASMYAHRDRVAEFAVGPLLRDYLRPGDTFHLVSFSGTAKAELSRRVEGRGDVEAIVARLLLLYPLDPYSDFIGVLEYLARYAADLPSARAKTIIVISDGEHAPPPSSPHFGKNGEATRSNLSAVSARIRERGWNFTFLEVPFEGGLPAGTAPAGSASTSGPQPSPAAAAPPTASPKDTAAGPARSSAAGPAAATAGDRTAPSEGQGSGPGGRDEAVLPETGNILRDSEDVLPGPVVEWDDDPEALSAGIGALPASFPAGVGRTGRELSVPVAVRNPSARKVLLETTSILVDGVDRMQRRAFASMEPRSEATIVLRVLLPEGHPEGEASAVIEPLFSGTERIAPSSARVSYVYAPSPLRGLFLGGLPVLVFLAGLAVAALVALAVLAVVRRLSGAPGRAAASAVAPRPLPGTESPTAPLLGGRKRDDEERAAVKDGARGTQLTARGTPQDAASAIAAKTSVAPASTAAGPSEQYGGPSRLEAAAPASKAPAGAGVLVPFKADRSPGVSALPSAAPSRDRVPAPAAVPLKRPDQRIVLSLFVEDQNTLIGRRNVHLLKSGASMSVGGGSSDFLIFLVDVPKRIADVHFDGEACVLVPRRPEFFPDSAGGPVQDCVGKRIRVVSEKGYQMFVRFDRYRDPLEELNRFLHSMEA